MTGQAWARWAAVLPPRWSYDHRPIPEMPGRAEGAAMQILIGLVVMLGFAVVVSGVLIVIAGLTGALGPDDPSDEVARVR